MNKILECINRGKKEGASLLTGGNRIGKTGYYVEPTVFADVDDNMSIARKRYNMYNETYPIYEPNSELYVQEDTTYLWSFKYSTALCCIM